MALYPFQKNFFDVHEGKHQKASRALFLVQSIAAKKKFFASRLRKKFFDTSKEKHQKARCAPGIAGALLRAPFGLACQAKGVWGIGDRTEKKRAVCTAIHSYSPPIGTSLPPMN